MSVSPKFSVNAPSHSQLFQIFACFVCGQQRTYGLAMREYPYNHNIEPILYCSHCKINQKHNFKDEGTRSAHERERIEREMRIYAGVEITRTGAL